MKFTEVVDDDEQFWSDKASALIFKHLERLSPEELRAAIQENRDPLLIFGSNGHFEDEASSLLSRIPWPFNRFVVRYTRDADFGPAIIRFINGGLKETAPEHWEVIRSIPGGDQYMVEAARQIIVRMIEGD